MWDCPWSNGRLKALSKAIRDDRDPGEDVPSYDDVILWYNDVAARVQLIISSHDWTPILGRRIPEVSSRAKTIDTLRDKLRRDPGTPLPSVQDVAGVRFEADMNLDEQDAVARVICDLFGQPEGAVRDLRLDPHSGYRAVHVWLRLPVRVEVQVRTRLQSAWANMYESMADVVGRGIRYGELPVDPGLQDAVAHLQAFSLHEIADFEQSYALACQMSALAEEAYAQTVRMYGDQTPKRAHDVIAGHREQFAKMEKNRADSLQMIDGQFQTVHKLLELVRSTMPGHG